LKNGRTFKEADEISAMTMETANQASRQEGAGAATAAHTLLSLSDVERGPFVVPGSLEPSV
jgi:hypothetical protein